MPSAQQPMTLSSSSLPTHSAVAAVLLGHVSCYLNKKSAIYLGTLINQGFQTLTISLKRILEPELCPSTTTSCLMHCTQTTAKDTTWPTSLTAQARPSPPEHAAPLPPPGQPRCPDTKGTTPSIGSASPPSTWEKGGNAFWMQHLNYIKLAGLCCKLLKHPFSNFASRNMLKKKKKQLQP